MEDMRISQLTRAQHGLITARQAHERGLTRSAIQHRLRTGEWEGVRSGIYRIAGLPETWHQHVLAAVLAVGDFALASHLTAARLWGLPLPDIDLIEVTAPLERRARLPGVRAHRSGVFTVADCTTVVRIPTTSPARALFDISSRFDERRIGKALDDGLRRGVITLSQMHRLAVRLPGIAPGRSPKRIQRLLEARIPGYDPGGSDLEPRVRRVLEAAELPLPIAQHSVTLRGKRFVLDFAYPDRLVVIEMDGFDFHGTRTVFDSDRSRQNLLVLAGWTMLRFTSNTSDAEIVESVRHALFGSFASR
jgi:hypothetical protein